jgi:uncharacterized metal-binding protein YceD (DUF177 family)
MAEEKANTQAEVIKVPRDGAAEVVAPKAEVAAPKRTVQELTESERLMFSETERVYLKAQIQINALSQQTQGAQKKFQDDQQTMIKKYDINIAEMVFDNVNFKFVSNKGVVSFDGGK